MRCARCHRTLKSPGLTVELKDGPLYFGSTCARESGLRTRRKGQSKPRAPARDSRTIDWVDTLGAAP